MTATSPPSHPAPPGPVRPEPVEGSVAWQQRLPSTSSGRAELLTQPERGVFGKSQAGTSAAAAGAQRLHAQRLANGDFMLPRCRACGALHFPPRVVCPACGGTGFDAVAASGRGVVASATVVRAPAASGGDRSVCLVDLEEGPRLMSRVDGIAPEQVSIGLAVVARVLQDEAGAPLLVFQRLAEVEREAGAEQAPAEHQVAADRVAR